MRCLPSALAPVRSEGCDSMLHPQPDAGSRVAALPRLGCGWRGWPTRASGAEYPVSASRAHREYIAAAHRERGEDQARTCSGRRRSDLLAGGAHPACARCRRASVAQRQAPTRRSAGGTEHATRALGTTQPARGPIDGLPRSAAIFLSNKPTLTPGDGSGLCLVLQRHAGE